MSIDLNKMAQEFARNSRSDVTPVECHWFARQVSEAVATELEHRIKEKALWGMHGVLMAIADLKREICGKKEAGNDQG